MKKFILCLGIVICSLQNSYSQDNLWTKIKNPQSVSAEKLDKDSTPSKFELFALNLDAMKQMLLSVPERNSGAPSNTVIDFPNPQGKLRKFRIYEASVMAPELAARHSEIKSYVGKGIDDPTATIRFSITIFGLHTKTFSASGSALIDPYTKDLQTYIVYDKSDLTTNKTFSCGFVDNDDIDTSLPVSTPISRANNSLFKTYRLAMACTIEYAAFHINAAGLNSGTLAQKKAAVLAAMVVTMTRVDGLYEKDLSLTMVLIPNNEDIIFVTSDSFDNANTDNILLDQSQTQIDAIIGTANYDIGHTVSTGGGGIAQLSSPCTASKARGITGLPSPVGDSFDIDFVSHEMGHQFGCAHTFNGDQGNCSGNRTQSSAYEPGSGSTIMSYSGICDAQNIQFNSNDYFHARSIVQASAFINGTGNCGVVVPNGNTAPVVDAGNNYTIPFGTAFVLKGTALDIDGDALTYCWEQYDNQISIQPPVATSTTGPNFRSYSPSISGDRYFPKWSDILANNLTPTWEVIPNVARTMNFSLLVRDNGTPNGGQSNRDTMSLTVANAGPFKVTSQNSNGVAWIGNSTENVTWDVAGTDANGIDTAFVNIKLSTDGGLTFPYTLAENTLNDGIEPITVPQVPASQNCRIMVEAVGNVYFAVNKTPFYLGYVITSSCTTYNYTGAPFTLADNASAFTVKVINVPTGGAISDVNITVNATHPNIQNLNIAVIRPGGVLTNLFNQQCAGSADLDVTFDAQGTTFTCASPTSGTYIPPTGINLDSYYGLNPQGNWQFGFRDLVAGDIGTINAISLEVCTQVIALATNNFEFEDFALFPNPNDGNFEIRLNSHSGNKIDIAVNDIRGRKIFHKSYNNDGPFSQSLKIDKAESGIYFVSISDGDKKVVKRIVIK